LSFSASQADVLVGFVPVIGIANLCHYFVLCLPFSNRAETCLWRVKKGSKEQQDVSEVTILLLQQHLPDWSSSLIVMVPVLFLQLRAVDVFLL